jgi:hypothetical protein
MATLRALSDMRPVAKAGVVAGGYAIAVLVAVAVVAVYIWLTDSPDRDLSSGMHAFGDGLLFLGVLTLASIPATGVGLFLLRPVRAFWIAASVVSLLYAATAIPAVIDHFALRLPPNGPMPVWPALLSLRLILAPFSGFAFFFAGLFAPGLRFRGAFFGAMTVEVVAFSCLATGWFIGR